MSENLGRPTDRQVAAAALATLTDRELKHLIALSRDDAPYTDLLTAERARRTDARSVAQALAAIDRRAGS